MATDAPVIPVLLVATGGYLAWFAVHYWRGQGEMVWPSTPIKAVLQGKPLPSASPATTADVQLSAYETSLSAAGQQQAAAEGSGGSITGPQPSGPAANIARLLLPKYGWAASEFSALQALWGVGESGWNANARNPTSGAYGVAQALGHGTSCSAAANGTNQYGPQYGLSCSQAQQANAGSALWQIRWGLGYIKAVYGSPSAALAAWQSRNPHWY